MASKDLSFGQKFALYAGAAALGAGLPFALASQLTLSDEALSGLAKHNVIWHKVHASVDEQINQAIRSAGSATTPNFSFNIQAQQTIDIKALNEEIVAEVAKEKAALQDANFRMSPIFALVAMAGVLAVRTQIRQDRRRREDALKP